MTKQAKEPTLQEQHAILVTEVTEKTEITVEFIEKRKLDVQQLQNILDNRKEIISESVPKNTKSINLSIVKYCLDNDITELRNVDMHRLIRLENVTNYFDVSDGDNTTYEPANIQEVNTDISLNYLVSNTDKKTSEQRKKDWFNRSNNYINSHITGQKISGNLFQHENSDYYFVKNSQNNFVLTSKETEKND